MGFLIAASIMCSITHHGKLIVFPCESLHVLSPEPPKIGCKGDINSKSMDIHAMSGYCRQRTDA